MVATDHEPVHADAATVERCLDEGARTRWLRVTHHHDGYTVRVGDRTRGRLGRSAAADRLREHPQIVTDWRFWKDLGPADGYRRAFLRWIEGADRRPPADRYPALADGITREWGQLLITATLSDEGVRQYQLRHRGDRGRPVDGLEQFETPRSARKISTFDHQDRYRPLKTAPSLRRGWVFPALDGPSLVDAVDFFYPATVANWHRERTGELDVTHYRETAGRQTGIYDLIEELDDENVGHLAAACCVDSQCLKRREWDLDEDTPLDVPRGEGEFPCREPCSLVVAAARTFTTMQSETPREYTFELTPSEKNQLEELIETVADGRIDSIREADLNAGANRYRVRYLRSKRLTETGLSDVPTFDEE